MTPKLKVMIIDDDPLYRKALMKYIHEYEDLLVVGEADDRATAMPAIERLKPDVALVDILGFEGDEGGIDMIREIKMVHQSLPIVAMSSFDPSFFKQRALDAGAQCYLIKQEADYMIGQVLRQAVKGKST